MERFFRYSLTFLIALVAGMEFIQVIMRYILHAPVLWLEETLIFPAIWMYFLGCANASRENTQIVAKVLDIFLKKESHKAALDTLASVCGTVISAWLTYWAWDYFEYSTRVWKQTANLFIPLAFAESAFFVGMILITAFTAWQIVKDFNRIRNPQIETETVSRKECA